MHGIHASRTGGNRKGIAPHICERRHLKIWESPGLDPFGDAARALHGCRGRVALNARESLRENQPKSLVVLRHKLQIFGYPDTAFEQHGDDAERQVIVGHEQEVTQRPFFHALYHAITPKLDKLPKADVVAN